MKLLVTGGSGLVGRALQNVCPLATFVSSHDYDLKNPLLVEDMFVRFRPTHVIHLAGLVGGVAANMKRPVEFFEDNIIINTNVLHYAHEYNVSRLVSCMSTCVFPNNVEYPLQPNKIHLGEPHESNFGYAYAKRMLEVQTRAYNTQHNRQWFTVIPTNVYGIHDNYNLESSHVIPALIHKCYLAKRDNTPLRVWGGGTAIREFIHADDVAFLLSHLIREYTKTEPIILSNPHQRSISEVVQTIAEAMEFTGEIVYDHVGPEGQTRKPSDISPLMELFPNYTYVDFTTGITHAAKWFSANFDSVRK
jgi:GDP-L-fucose synthase